jgi:hypothetical protein
VSWNESSHSENKFGQYLLYNTVQNKTAVQGRLERPNSGNVADNGCFSIEDWQFGNDLCGTFYVFSPAGEELVRKMLSANIIQSGISNDGRFAFCRTANNRKSADGNLLFAFDVEKNIQMFSMRPTIGLGEYEFIGTNGCFVCITAGGVKFRYDAQGNLLTQQSADPQN